MGRSAVSKKRPGERTALTPDEYADAALALIDGDGLEGFSTRKLGAALGVEAMAIYHHFPSKAALLDAVAERLLLLAPAPVSPPEDWQQWMRELGWGYFGLAKTHPRAFQLLAARRFNTDKAFAWFERTLSVLSLAGLPPALRARVFRALGAVVNGAGMAYVATVEHAADPGRLSDSTTADRYPEVAAVAADLGLENQDELFDFTLEAMIRALAPLVAEHARSG
jgi:AcrR family transcriptional regulator